MHSIMISICGSLLPIGLEPGFGVLCADNVQSFIFLQSVTVKVYGIVEYGLVDCLVLLWVSVLEVPVRTSSFPINRE